MTTEETIVLSEEVATAPSESTTTTVTVELNKDQIAFLTKWKKTHEEELGIEVPLGALVRKTVDGAMKNAAARATSADKSRDGDRKPSFGGGRDRKPSFGGDRKPSFGGGRPSGRPSLLGGKKRF